MITGRDAVYNRMSSYTYTGTSLVDEVIVRAKDTSLSRPQVLSFINDTQNSILNRRVFPQQEKDYSGALAIEAYEFVMPTEIQLSTYVELDDENGNTFKPVYETSRDFFAHGIDVNTNVPGTYTIFGRSLVFSCKADRNFQVRVKYVAAPTQLSEEAQTPTIPVEYKESLVIGGLAGIEEMRGNFDIATLYRRRIEDTTDDFTRRYARKTSTPNRTRPQFRR